MTLRKTLLSSCKLILLISIANSTSAFADFNPYTIFNSNTAPSSTTTASNTNVNQATSTSNSSAPSSMPSTNTGALPSTSTQGSSSTSSSVFVQPKALTTPGQLIAPATNPAPKNPNPAPSSSYSVPNYKNYNTTPPSAYTTTNSIPSSTNNVASLIPPFIPAPNQANSNTNNGMVVSGGDIITLLNSINHGVSSINGNVNQLTNWQNTRNNNETAAGAALIPSTPNNLSDFLFNQSGYNSLTNLPQVNNNTLTRSVFQSSAQNNNGAATNNDSFNNLSTTAFLALPSTYSGIMQTTALVQSAASQDSKNKNDGPQANVKINLNANSLAQQYYSDLVGSLPTEAHQMALYHQEDMYDLIAYTLDQIATQTKPVNTSDSEMSLFQSAVNAPFNSNPDTSGKTWFQQLSTASNPQILRSIAILSATQNQMQYQELQNTQTQNMMQAGALTELTAIEQNLTKIAQSEQQMAQAQQQTNVLLQQLLVQMSTQKK